MRTKFVNEDIKDFLVPKTTNEIKKSFKEIQQYIIDYLVEENSNFSKFIFDTSHEEILDDFINFAQLYLPNSPFARRDSGIIYAKAYSKEFGPFIFVIDWNDLRGYLSQKNGDHVVDTGNNYDPISHEEFIKKYEIL